MERLLEILTQFAFPALTAAGDPSDENLARLAELSHDELVELQRALGDVLAEHAAVEPRTVESVANLSRTRNAMVVTRAEIDGRPEAEQARLEAEADEIMASAVELAPRRPIRPSPAAALGRVTGHQRPRPASSANVPLVITAAGADITREGVHGIGQAMVRAMRDAKASPGTALAVHRAVTLRHDDLYSDDRRLDLGSHERNVAKVEAVVAAGMFGQESLTAAGGLCAPVAPDYSQVMISVADRPLRDDLPQFGASRGGIGFISPPTLTDLAAGVGIWTEATDANPGNSTKAIAQANCGDEVQVVVDAVTMRLELSNWSRYFEERVTAQMDLLMANWARLAENNLLTGIDAASTATTAGQLLGITRDLLAVIDRTIEAFRWRYRMGANAPMRLVAPRWLNGAIRADLARQSPGDSGGGMDRLGVSDAEIDAWFAVRNVNVTRTLDDVAPNWVSQGVGQLAPWPEDLVLRVFHEGAFQFLDGGTLDLGIVRDSTLNEVNRYQTFAESYEAVAYRGLGSLKVTIQHVCPNGQAAELVDTTAECLTGS